MSISRSTARRILLVLAIAFLLAPRLYVLLIYGFPSFDSTAGERAVVSNNLHGFLMALVPSAFLVAVMTKPRKMSAAYWFVPAYFAVSGFALIVRGAVLLADPVLRFPSVDGLFAMGFGSLCLGLLFWLVRPVDSETDGQRGEGVTRDAGEAAPA